MGGSIFLTIFFGIFFAVGFGILGFGLRSMHMSKQAESWPTAPAEITSSDFIVSSDDDGTTYRTKLTYNYNVAGRDFTGKKIAFGYAGSSSRKFHDDIYDALPVGSQVAARYNPDNPEQAVLSFGINQSIMFLILFGATWTLFTAGMAAMFWLSETGAGGLVENLVIYSRGRG